MLIESHKNPRIQRAIRLRKSRERKKTGLFLIDGLREISRAYDAGVHIAEFFIRDTKLPDATAQWLEKCRGKGTADWLEVSRDIFDKVNYGDRDDGIVAVAHGALAELSSLKLSAVPTLLILEGMEKPGNLGAVLRTADATGVDAIVLVDSQVDSFNPNVIRASMGAAFTVPVVRAEASEIQAFCQEHSITILAARVDAKQTYEQMDMRRPLAIAFGSEAQGLSESWAASGIEAIRLPMGGIVDSLNVSVTAGVLLYEILRQRQLTLG
jgi:TrmH family RNA methyltransferase